MLKNKFAVSFSVGCKKQLMTPNKTFNVNFIQWLIKIVSQLQRNWHFSSCDDSITIYVYIHYVCM